MNPSAGLADLDYRPVERGAGLGERLRAVGRSPRLVIGGTVSVLTLAVPAVALVVMVARGHTEDGGLLFFLGLVAAGGLYAIADVLRQAGGPGGLERFAEVNGLRHLSGSVATHYRGSRFADGSHVVESAVRLDGDTLVEVGDLFPVTPLRMGESARVATAYLRVVVDGALPVGAADVARRVVDAVAEKELTALFGPVAVEVGWREVTVYGTRGLRPREKGRLRSALVLAERIGVAATDAADRSGPAARRTRSGISIPEPARKAAAGGRRLHPAVLVLGTLAALIVLPLLFAVVMSSLEPVTRGNGLVAAVVVGVMVAVVLAVVSRLVRLAHTHRRAGDGAGREAR
ncbi:hypothetical protein [Nocardioides sp. CFH 31398]|uniref:hypothetical protein n=1 Tax=Nocardioides sp. CFH 31398 TaxID=2919579 RepID=UPI001F059FD6|nr:hypothetical protein [Nocardioides sp. CFH 31398]MCH1867329.1 hypothetical protein [Nocardioides sp. CFH 31398]